MSKERKLFTLKLATMAIFLVNAVLQPAVFSRNLSINEYAFLTTFLGVISYGMLFDAGFGRAFYIELRERFAKKKEIDSVLAYTGKFYYKIGLFLFLSFLLIAFVCGKRFGLSTETWIYVYSFVCFSSVFFGMYRPVLNACDRYISSEYMDIYKRFISTVLIISLFFFELEHAVIIISLLSLYILGYLIREITLNCVKDTRLSDFEPNNLRKNVKKSFVFSFSELTIYNLGYVIVPIYYSDEDIVVFGIAMRVFLAMVIGVRIFADTMIHKFSLNFLNGNITEANEIFIKTRNITLLVALFIVCIFMSLYDILLPIWIKNYTINLNMALSISIFLVSNAILHVAGSFSAVTERGLSISKNISLIFASIMILVLLISANFASLEWLLISYSLSYFIFSLITYFCFTRYVLREPNG